MEKSKTEKSPWKKARMKQGPKKKYKKAFTQERKTNLVESDKEFWFGQQ